MKALKNRQSGKTRQSGSNLFVVPLVSSATSTSPSRAQRVEGGTSWEHRSSSTYGLLLQDMMARPNTNSQHVDESGAGAAPAPRLIERLDKALLYLYTKNEKVRRSEGQWKTLALRLLQELDLDHHAGAAGATPPLFFTDKGRQKTVFSQLLADFERSADLRRRHNDILQDLQMERESQKILQNVVVPQNDEEPPPMLSWLSVFFGCGLDGREKEQAGLGGQHVRQSALSSEDLDEPQCSRHAQKILKAIEDAPATWSASRETAAGTAEGGHASTPGSPLVSPRRYLLPRLGPRCPQPDPPAPEDYTTPRDDHHGHQSAQSHRVQSQDQWSACPHSVTNVHGVNIVNPESFYCYQPSLPNSERPSVVYNARASTTTSKESSSRRSSKDRSLGSSGAARIVGAKRHIVPHINFTSAASLSAGTSSTAHELKHPGHLLDLPPPASSNSVSVAPTEHHNLAEQDALSSSEVSDVMELEHSFFTNTLDHVRELERTNLALRRKIAELEMAGAVHQLEEESGRAARSASATKGTAGGSEVGGEPRSATLLELHDRDRAEDDVEKQVRGAATSGCAVNTSAPEWARESMK